MALLACYPLSSSILIAALAATASVFLFARPQYQPPNQGSEVKLDLASDDKGVWNISQVKPAELAPARAAARRWGVAPRSVRLISAIRLGPHDLTMIVAGTSAADERCLGFVTPSEAPAFYCGTRLDAQSAFVVVTTRRAFPSEGKTMQPTFLTGIARADVTGVVVDHRPDWHDASVYDRRQGSLWGTFELSLSGSRGIRVSVYGKEGLIAGVPIDVLTPGDRLVTIPG